METLSAWSRALRDPSLRDLPYKFETNEYGQLVMNPTKPLHGYLKSQLSEYLRKYVHGRGRSVFAFPVVTSRGVKVADVVWISDERWSEARDAEASPIAAEICVEILSQSNTAAEIEGKRRLYFEQGAIEVWTCDLEGRIRFFDRGGEEMGSRLVPGFPRQIAI